MAVALIAILLYRRQLFLVIKGAVGRRDRLQVRHDPSIVAGIHLRALGRFIVIGEVLAVVKHLRLVIPLGAARFVRRPWQSIERKRVDMLCDMIQEGCLIRSLDGRISSC